MNFSSLFLGYWAVLDFYDYAGYDLEDMGRVANEKKWKDSEMRMKRYKQYSMNEKGDIGDNKEKES